MKQTSSIFRWLITLGACCAIAYALYYFNLRQNASAASNEPMEFPETVEAIKVGSTTWVSKTKALGEVVATRIITIRNELEGTIVALNLPSGGQIKQGQILVQLDSSEEQANLANARANLELAEIELRRNKKLYKQGVVSQDNYDKARIQVTIQQAKIDAITSLIDKKTIKAPFDAVAGLHSLEVGQYLSANSEINTLVSVDDKIWVDFKLPQQFAYIQTGTELQVKLPYDEVPVKGKILAKNTLLNRAARSLTFRAEITNTDQLLKPGIVVNVLVPTSVATQAIEIPTSAIMRDQFSTYVYFLTPAQDNKNYRATRREITIGEEFDSSTIVTSGLNINDLIVSLGAFKLRPDLLVTFDPKANALDKPQ
ncbi:efflux RND transporter periplasmic adaptor subunit [Agaribacter marinus]|uniref:MexH family multidrug efflux RND transporter periplasmic adaptor subunit n=1 Tax=Agaribacter marinus TaxID=1431249 RepID=A0AA37WJK9_9ALTE|nr:efflux RND transporter periplasmic adaptor subunit [Agaribacter marinus]GLR72257.1 MexH family multidrug efflux RND transporter periplasmic adaptor subunit [Agaribacter marinus]